MKMIKLDENVKSEAQLRLEEKIERDRKKLQEQIKKEQKRLADLKNKAKSYIGDLFITHLPDFYYFEAAELKEIIDTAMTQKATLEKIEAIRKTADTVDGSGIADAESAGSDKEAEQYVNEDHQDNVIGQPYGYDEVDKDPDPDPDPDDSGYYDEGSEDEEDENEEE